MGRICSGPSNCILVLRAYHFDDRQGAAVDEAWESALRSLKASQLLWLDLLDSTEPEVKQVEEALGVEGLAQVRGENDAVMPKLEQREGYIKLTAVGVATDGSASEVEAVPIVCFVGENWVISAHAVEIPVIDEFRQRAEGGGEIGALDAPSFLAALLEWVVASYLRAFDEIDLTLEDFDLQVLRSTPRDAEQQIGLLVDARGRISSLRRLLAPHRDLFSALSHSEFDAVSTEASAQRFTDLATRVTDALAAARDTKDGVTGSFDILLARSGYRTNETMKILTLASVLLLPGSLLAGVAGMNVNISMGVFARSPLFWVVSAVILSMSAGTLLIARRKQWI